MAIGVVPFALQNASHSASVFRIAQSAPFTSGGVLSSVELGVTQQASPNMSVVLGPGRAQIVGTSVSPPSGQNWSTQAQYSVYNDANVTMTIATSSPVNPRIDALYVQAQDAFYSGSTNTAVAAVATGTPAVSPVAPSIPSNAILLAYIAVAANATTIVSANITSKATVAQTLGQVQVATQTFAGSLQANGVAVTGSTYTITQRPWVQTVVVTVDTLLVGSVTAAGSVVFAIAAGGTAVNGGTGAVAIGTSGVAFATQGSFSIAAGSGTVAINLATSVSSGTLTTGGTMLILTYAS